MHSVCSRNRVGLPVRLTNIGTEERKRERMRPYQCTLLNITHLKSEMMVSSVYLHLSDRTVKFSLRFVVALLMVADRK